MEKKGKKKQGLEEKITKRKNSKKKSCKTLRRVELGQTIIRVSEAQVEIATMAKNWKITYGDGTTPYLVITSLIMKNQLDSLRTLITALYSTSIFFVDANTVMRFFEIVEAFKGVNRGVISEEEDKEILDELQRDHNVNNPTEDDMDAGAANIAKQKEKESKLNKEDEKNDGEDSLEKE